VRSRFDAAHELGHIILHRHIDKTCITRKADFKLIEQQAHRFAGAFLLPAQSFSNDFFSPTLDTFQALKPRWGASMQFMLHRTQELGLISETQAQRLWANCARRGWRLREPLDDEISVEEPRLLRRSFEMLINEEVQTRAEILSALPYSPRDIEDLAGLPIFFLEEISIPISLKGFSKERSSGAPDNETRGRVVEFRLNKEHK
jgi:Zn-dependent peptidase ImmA (M78 family)